MRRAAGTGVAVGIVTAVIAAAPAVGAPGAKVTICHATSSASNPYVTITVAASAVDGSRRNDHSSHARDIIPPGPWLPEGLNWDAAGIATFANGCVPVRPADTDRDGTPDIADRDDDGDGTPDTRDPGDELGTDTDRDGNPDAFDPDDDGDGIGDGVDPDSPSSRDTDGDTVPDARDPDVDGDCVANAADADADGDGVANAEEHDADSDGIADLAEGLPDAPLAADSPVAPAASSGLVARAGTACADAPQAPAPPADPDPGTRDTDGDDVPDATDRDDDNDGVVDGRDGDADGDGFPETAGQAADVDAGIELDDRELAVAPAVTSEGQVARASVRCAPALQGRALGMGDVSAAAMTRSLCDVRKAADGSLEVSPRTSSPTAVTVTFSAPATGDARALREVRRYVLRG